MIAAFHRARTTEDGQALVLAAVVALALAVCLLGTASLGRTVVERVQLQAAADAAAYSQAAMEARVLNFTAYTNRAMVVHYASAMAATAYLAWAHYLWAGIQPLLEIGLAVPFVQEVVLVIQRTVQVLLTILDVGLAALLPLLAAANVVLYALQEGAWWSLTWGRLASALPPEAEGGSSASRPYAPIWPKVLPRINQMVFAQTRGHPFLPADSADAQRILLDARDEGAQRARLQMLEIANSARDPWTAYGDRLGNPALSPLARHFRAKVACVDLATLARTEMGTAPASARAAAVPVQIWSAQKLQGGVDCWPVDTTISFFSFTAIDGLPGGLATGGNSSTHVWSPGGVVGRVLAFAIPILGAALSGMSSAAGNSRPSPDTRLFWMSPFVNFAARASAQPGVGPLGALGNFGQPDVLVGLAKESRDLDAEHGAERTFSRRFSFADRRGRASADLGMSRADWPHLRGPGGLALLHEGLNAFAAAQVYYHRPGDWKEMPNFFNPLWGARLMPVLESNAAAKLGLSSVPALRQFLRH